MQLYLRNWYDKFLEEISKTKRLRIVAPFVKEQILQKIHENFDFANLEIITRFNLRDFASNVSDLNGLKFSVVNKAAVFGVRQLHSKIYIFDDRSAIISSANLTYGGLVSNYECGVLLTDKKTIHDIREHFEDLKSIAGNQLTIEQYEDWENQLSKMEICNTSIPALPDYGSSQININREKNYFVKFFGTASNRAPMSYQVREEIDRALCHYACGFSINKKPRQIRDGDIIYMARMTNPRDYAIFGKAEAVRFIDGRDRATELEVEQRPWKSQWPIYLRVKNPTFIDGTMADCVLLSDVIKALDYESFKSTKEKYKNGERTINPSKSLRQQAYVMLTHSAAEWLEPRFQEGLNRMGKVDNEFIDSLPKSEIDIEKWQ
uniref:Phospholipase D/Transphosphatidylase n=1 Tax=Sphingobacterium sp. (strain 21) TaxID=743722 RepID=F4C8W4_SPHS2